jgi:hypothetical protein
MEEEASRSGAGVNRIGQALELNAFLVKFSDQIYQVPRFEPSGVPQAQSPNAP